LYAGDVGIGINPALAATVREADLLLVLGPRLGEMTTSGYTLLQSPKPAQKLVHIHADATELNRVYHAELAICATMNAAARSLEVLDAPPSVPWAAHTAQVHANYLACLVPNALPGQSAEEPRGPMDMAHVVEVAGRLMPANTVYTNGAGNFASWLHRFHRYHGLAKGLKTQLAPTNGAMGYGVPAGIAAAIATGRPVFTIAGDGDFMMNGQELATAVQHGAKTIVVLVNNGAYGTIRMHQEREYPLRNAGAGSGLSNPDFCALAAAYGLASERLEHSRGFEAALQRAINREGSSLIELVLDANIISPRTTLEAIQKR
jgi:acetolactate synthase I/II/III large subunit